MASIGNNNMTDPTPAAADIGEDVGDGGGGPSAEDAAAIMATLKPSSVSTTDQRGVATKMATKPNNASSIDASSSSKEKSQKKRKKYTTGGSSSGGSSSFKRMDDSEFVRCMASEFKRRGYTVALQLKPETNDNNIAVPDFPPLALLDDGTAPPPAAGTQLEGGESAATDGQLQPPPTKKVKTTSDMHALTNKKKKSQPQPVALPSFSFYPSSVSISEKNVNSWNNMFEQLKSYHDGNNGALPLHHTPQQQQTDTSTTNNNSNYDIGTLCKWTKAQLTLWKRMKKDNKHNLSLDRIAKLHSLNFDRSCSSQFNMALTVGGGSGGVDGEQLLGGGGEGMDNDVLDYQLSVGGKNAQKWQEKFDELKHYKDLHGDTNVPRSYDDSLSKWCATQRLRCKEILNGNENIKTPMTRVQFQMLENIGFDMSMKRKSYDRSVLDKKWDDKFQEVLRYKEKFGNCDIAVRKGLEEYKQLANWAGLQRRKFKAKQTGTKAGRTSGITDEQIKKLASIGFSFSLQDDFDTRFKHLLEFKKEFGHTKVPVFYTGYNNLGRWAKRMRDGIRNNEPWMDDVRKSRLLGIEFDIAARHVFGEKTKLELEQEAVDNVDAAVLQQPNIGMSVEMPSLETQAVLAATTMAAMDNNDIRMNPPPGTLFYHNYADPQPHQEPL